jgi:multiple sugar transport system substrate-binding protein
LLKRMKLAVAGLLLTTAAGCGGSESVKTEPVEKPAAASEPVTLKMQSNLTPEVFQKYFAEPVHKKHSHITLEQVNLKNDAEWLAAVTAGKAPDLVWSPNGILNTMKKFDLQMDMAELIAKHKFDLSRIEPALISETKQYSDKGILYALPPNRATTALMYNKDLFDRFSVRYPQEGVTWPQIVELARKMTRTQDGVSYHGVDLVFLDIVGQSGLKVFGADDKASVTGDGWKRLFDLNVELRRASGYKEAGKGAPIDRFVKDQNLAMVASGTAGLFDMPEIANQQFNWDMLPYPAYPDTNGQGTAGLAFIYAVTATSKHKDEAFRAIASFFDTESLIAIARAGIVMPSVTDPAVLQQYGKDSPVASMKNTGALVKRKPAQKDTHPFSPTAYKLINTKMWDVVNQKSDTNTTLRASQEEIDRQWAQEKSK